MPKVQIVIPCINLWNKYTRACIESVKTKYPYRIMLIDNASEDETLTEASKLVSDTFAHYRSEERMSFSKSCNVGIRDAFERGYDYVFVLNNDTLLHPDAIDNLVMRFLDEERRTQNPNHNLAMATCMDVTGECRGEPQAVLKLDVAEKIAVPETEHPCFSGFMINKMCWEKVGEFDENFKPAYYEDNDYHYRINLAGLKAIVLPTSMFYHYGSRTQLEAIGRPLATGTSNMQYYIKKWGGLPGREIYKTPFNK